MAFLDYQFVFCRKMAPEIEAVMSAGSNVHYHPRAALHAAMPVSRPGAVKKHSASVTVSAPSGFSPENSNLIPPASARPRWHQPLFWPDAGLWEVHVTVRNARRNGLPFVLLITDCRHHFAPDHRRRYPTGKSRRLLFSPVPCGCSLQNSGSYWHVNVAVRTDDRGPAFALVLTVT